MGFCSAGINLFNFNSRNTRATYAICNLFKVNNKGTKTTSFGAFLVFLLLTLNRFHTLF